MAKKKLIKTDAGNIFKTANKKTYQLQQALDSNF